MNVRGFGVALPSFSMNPLTFNPEKERLYLVDPAYRSGLRSIRSALGENADLNRLVLVIVKPDAFYFRKVGRILDVLRENDFIPVVWREFRFSWHQIFDLWRYQLTKATDDRLSLACELLGCDPSLIVLFKAPENGNGVPASVRLWALKGAFDSKLRHRSNLRDALAVPHRMFGLIHATDEPIDLVREFGVLLAHRDRLELLRQCQRNEDQSRSIASYLERRYAATPAVAWMSAQEALSSLRAHWARKQRDPVLLDRIGSLIEPSAPGRLPASGRDIDVPQSFDAFYPVLDQLRGGREKRARWLVYMIAAQVLQMDREDARAILSSGDADIALAKWTAAAAGSSKSMQGATLR